MLQTLKKYELDGWVVSNKHPTFDLYIWNYTQATQYASNWDEITLMCRSLVTDGVGNIVSRGFSKFFNWEENKLDLTKLNINDIRLFEKVDGSYIGVFYYANQWITRSKGSFITEQAIKAKEHLNSFVDFDSFFDKDLTHNFEIIYPNNRICVDYGNRDEIVYLTSTNNLGDKIRFDELPIGMNSAKLYDFKFDYKSIKDMDLSNEEGMVGVFPTGEMFKLKYDNYVKLHGLITRTSSYTIWECLKNGENLNLLIENIPDEFYGFVKNTVTEIEDKFNTLKEKVVTEYVSIENRSEMTDKEFAGYVMKNTTWPSQMFSFRNNRSIENWLWREVKPEYKLPFKDE